MRMRIRLALALLLVVVTVGTVCGCGESDSPGAGAVVTSEEIVARVASSQAEIRTCRYEITISGVAFMGESILTGAMDFENRRASFEMEMSVWGNRVSMEYYVLADTMYCKMPLQEEGDRWIKAEILGHESFWETGDPVDDQVSVLENSLEWLTAGSGEVKGVDCHILEVVPDFDKLCDVLDLEEDMSGVLFEDIALRFWISKADYFPTKMDLSMTMRDPETDTAYEWHQETVLYDHNKPLDIQLPPEAQSATEVSPDVIEY